MSSNIYFNNSKVFSGVTSYNELEDATKPLINSVILEGNRTAGELNLMTRDEITQLIAQARSVVILPDYPATPKEGVLYYIGSTSPYNVCLYAKNSQDVLERVDLGTTNVDISSKQDVTDNNLTTTSKNIVGAINENKANIDLKQNITDDSLITTNKTIPTAINEIVNNKVSTLEDNVNNITYLTTKAVYDNFAPVSTTKYVGTFKSPNDCIVPFGFHRILNMANERATVEGLFVSQMADPVNSSVNLFGDLKVRQQCYGGSVAGSATNICIEQTFETYFRGSPTERKVFFRRGYLANSATDIDINDVVAIKNSLTWLPWYPVEYPMTTLTKQDTATAITNFEVKACVSGTTLFINIRNITSNADIARTSSLVVFTCPFGQFKKPANELYFSTLYNFSTTNSEPAGIQLITGGNVELFGIIAGKRYLGCMSIPLGY